MNRMSVRGRLGLLVTLLCTVTIAVGVAGMRATDQAIDGFKAVNDSRVVPLRDLKVIADMYAVNIVDATHKTRNANFTWDEGLNSLEDARKTIAQKWPLYKSRPLHPEERKLVAEIEPMLADTDAQIEKLEEIFAAKDKEALARFTIDKLYPLIDPVSGKFSELIEVQLKLAGAEYDRAYQGYTTSQVVNLSLIGVGVGLGLLLAWWIVRSITGPLGDVRRMVIEVARTADFSRRVPVSSNDDVGQTAQAFNQLMQTQQSAIEAVNRTAVAMAAGDFSQTVEADLSGDLQTMKDAVNRSVGQMRLTVEELRKVSQALRAGQFNVASEAQLTGAFGEVVRDSLDAMAGLEAMLGNVGQVMQSVAAGDLSQQVVAEGRGDLARLKENINASLQSMGAAMRAIHANTRQVAAAASEASHAIGHISDGAQNQTHAISQVAVAVKQSASSVTDVSRSTGLASEKSRESIATMRSGMAKMDALVQTVNNLATNSEKINKITEVIEKIANKTNLLSLNAAIEAARAGEHGKGFSVVAEEVGKLAVSSAESSQEIAKLVQEAVQEISRAVVTVRDVSADMASIEGGSTQTDAMLQRISAALEEQSTAVEEINANISSLDKIARSNAAASEEITATVVELSKIADSTRREVERFNV